MNGPPQPDLGRRITSLSGQPEQGILHSCFPAAGHWRRGTDSVASSQITPSWIPSTFTTASKLARVHEPSGGALVQEIDFDVPVRDSFDDAGAGT